MTKVIIITIFIFWTSFTPFLFGAENYEDCILENMKGGDVAAKAIKDACKAKHINSIFSICAETEAQIINGIIFLPNMTEPFTGNNLCEYANGQVKSKGETKDGKKDGKWTAWSANSQMLSEKHYKDGKKDGKWTAWSENSQIGLDAQILSERHYMDGTLVSETRYAYHDNGLIWLEKHYKDGKKDGKWTAWYESGQIWSEEHHKDGKKNGKRTAWYESGLIWSEEHYKDGKKDGKWTAWSANSQMLSEKHYKDGKKDGKWTAWYNIDQILSEEYYKDGKCISGDCY